MQQREDFAKVVVAFLSITVAVLAVLPINRAWVIVASLLLIIACVIQWYWNKHLK